MTVFVRRYPPTDDHEGSMLRTARSASVKTCMNDERTFRNSEGVEDHVLHMVQRRSRRRS